MRDILKLNNSLLLDRIYGILWIFLFTLLAVKVDASIEMNVEHIEHPTSNIE